MRPWGGLIHISLGSGSGLGTNLHELHNLLGPNHGPLTDAIHIHPLLSILPNLQILLLRPEQITNNLIINLYITSPDHKRSVLILTRLNIPKNILHTPRHDPPLIIVHVIAEALHGVGFAGARLPVGEYGGVVALEGAADG